MAEVFERRPPPPRPYAWGGQVLSVTVAAVGATLQMLQRAGARESGAFWYGERTPEGGIVRAVLAPRQRMERDWFDVPPPAMSEMAEVLRDTDWRPLAQIHSHPGPRVEHSVYDDRMIGSRRALSLVVPHYGRWRGPWPSGLGVHEHQDDYWHLLDEAAAGRRVRLGPPINLLVRDLRS